MPSVSTADLSVSEFESTRFGLPWFESVGSRIKTLSGAVSVLVLECVAMPSVMAARSVGRNSGLFSPTVDQSSPNHVRMCRRDRSLQRRRLTFDYILLRSGDISRSQS